MKELERMREIASQMFKDASTPEELELSNNFSEEISKVEQKLEKQEKDNKELVKMAQANAKHTSFKESTEEASETGEYIEFGEFLRNYKEN